MRILFTAAALIGIAATAHAQTVSQPSFCERLAAQTGMKPTNKPKMWEIRTMNGLKAALIGDSTTVMMGVGSAGPATAEEYERLSKTCKPAKKGPQCDLVGPVELQLTIKNGEQVRQVAEAGEAAQVAMIGSRVRCTDL